MPGNDGSLSYEEWKALGTPAPKETASDGSLSYDEWKALSQDNHASRTRGIGETINDTVIEGVNSAAGMVGAIGSFIKPGNPVSEGIDSFIKDGEKHQSDVVRADKEKFHSALKKSETIGDDLSAVADYIMSSPLQVTAQAIGSFGPTGIAMKTTKVGTGLMGAGERAATIAARTTGVGMGVAGGGGDAAGDAYKLVQETPDEVLKKHPVVIDLLAKGVPFDQIKDDIATRAARKASILPGIAGGVAGAFGAEKLLAGSAIKDGYKHVLGTGLVEGGTEAAEEGIAQYTGRSAAQQYNPAIDPTKNVAAMAAMGGVQGFGVGAVVAAITPSKPDPAILNTNNIDDALAAANAATAPNANKPPPNPPGGSSPASPRSAADIAQSINDEELLNQLNNRPVDQGYVPQPEAVERPPIEIAPDVQPLVDNVGLPVVQPAIEQSQPTDLAIQAAPEFQPTEGQNVQDTTPATQSIPTAATPEIGSPVGIDQEQVAATPLADTDADIGGKTQSLARDSSWVIKNKETGEVIMETFDKAKVDALNTAKYEAVPALQYMQELNVPVDRSHTTVNSDLTTTPASILPSKPTTQQSPSTPLPASAPQEDTQAKQVTNNDAQTESKIQFAPKAAESGAVRTEVLGSNEEIGNSNVQSRIANVQDETIRHLRSEILKYKGEVKSKTGSKVFYDATDRLKAIAEDTLGTTLKAQQVWFNSQRKKLDKNGDTEAAALFEQVAAHLRDRIKTANEPAPVKVDEPLATVASDVAERTAEVVRDATIDERIASEKAKPVNDLSRNPTGWKRIDGANKSSVTLVSFDGKKAIKFVTKDTKSGAESLRMRAKAHTYAIDNPYAGTPIPEGDLDIKPLMNKTAEVVGDESSQPTQEPKPQPENKPADEVSKAKEHLDAAGIQGKERLDAIGAVKRGDITADDVAEASPEPVEEAPAAIEDFGQKIEGAKKDLAAAVSKVYGDDDIATMPLSKIWPANLSDKIEDKFIAALAFAARAEIPSKPRKPYAVKVWVGKVKALRELVSMVLSNDTTRAKAEALLNETKVLEGFNAKVKLLESIDRDQWGRIGNVREYPDAIRYDGDNQVLSPFVSVQVDGTTQSFRGAHSVADIIDSLNEKLGVEKKAAKMKFEVRGRGEAYFINKAGDSEYRKLKTFKTAKEALEYKNDHYDDLVAAWEDVKNRDNVKKDDVRGEENRPRTAEDWRKGKDVTAEQFSEAFGFRGGQFGNWVSQGKNAQERQWMLNSAYDAFMDLSSILNIPPKAISLDGQLAMSFGARGSGKHSAHFESDQLVINLTKTRGAGTLAHEWFHALDNYFQRSRNAPMGNNRESRYVTYAPEAYYQDTDGMKMSVQEFENAVNHDPIVLMHGQDRATRDIALNQRRIGNKDRWKKYDAIRPEVEQKFSELVEALNASPMVKRALTIDKGQSDGYWSRIIERAARSFENYIIAKMSVKGYNNDYLANVVNIADFKRDEERYPYLKDEELAPVVEAFDNLFGEIKSKETDKGVALFSKSTPAPNTHTVASATSSMLEAHTGKARAVLQAMLDSGKVKVVTTEEAADVVGNELMERGGGVWGFYNQADGITYFVADGLPRDLKDNELRSLVLHEISVHAFRLGKDSTEFRSILKQVEMMKEAGNKAIVAAFNRVPDDTATDDVTEEILAYLVQSNPDLPIVQKFIAWFRNAIRAIGKSFPTLQKLKLHDWAASLNEKDLRFMAESALRNSERSGVRSESDAPLFSKSSQTDTPAFKKWFGESRVVDADGKPLVVYHGTHADFSEFDMDKSVEGGIFLTAKPDHAEFFGNKIMPLFVSMKNPMVVDGATLPDEHSIEDIERLIGRAKGGGHDGIVIEGFKDYEAGKADTYIALKPSQIKSATGNNGNFSKSDNNILFSKSNPAPSANAVPAETPMQGKQRIVQDKFNRFKVLQDWLKSNGMDLSENADVYLAETLMSGRISSRTQDFRENQMAPLIKKTQRAGISMEQIGDFLKMQHAPEANKRARLLHDDPQATAFGISDKEAKEAMDTYKARPDFKELKAIADEWRDVTTQSRKILLDSGIISPEMAKSWEDTYSVYIPVKGAKDETGTGKGLSVNGRQKARLGHGLRDEAILENIWRDHERAISLDEKNLVGKALIRFALEAQNDDIITVSKPVKRQVLKAGQSSYMVTFKGNDIAAFHNQSDAQQHISIEVNKGGKKSDFDIVKTTDPARVMMQASPMLADNEVNVYVGGHAVRLQINDEIAARAYTNLGVEHLNAVLSAGRSFNNWLSKAYTGYSPDFIFTNPIRDAIQGSATLTANYGAGMAAKVFANYPMAVKELFKHFRKPGSSALVADYRANGGSTGAAYLSDLERIGSDMQDAYDEYAGMFNTYHRTYAKAIMEGRSKTAANTIASLKSGAAGVKKVPVIGHFLRLMERVNAITENALRVATYHTLVKNKVSKPRAAAQAKNLMNFNRKGEISNQAGALFLFFNPNVQGTQVMYQALFEAKHKGQARTLAGMMVLSAFAIAAMNRGGGDDDEEKWKSTPDHIKDGNIVFKIPGFDDYQITLTLPYGYRVFHMLGNVLSDYMHGEDGYKLGIRMASGVFANFSPVGNPMEGEHFPFQVMPTVAKMALGPGLNENSFGQSIAPQRFNDAKPDSQLMFRSTKGGVYASTAEKLNELSGGTTYRPGNLDVSPETLKFWVSSLTGGAGQAAMDILSLPRKLTSDASTPIRDMPVIKRFVREVGISDKRAAFYDKAEEAKKAANEFGEAIRHRDAKAAPGIIEKNIALIALSKYADKQQQLITLKRDEVDRIRNDDTLSPLQKEMQTKKIEKEEEGIYSAFIKKFETDTKNMKDKELAMH